MFSRGIECGSSGSNVEREHQQAHAFFDPIKSPSDRWNRLHDGRQGDDEAWPESLFCSIGWSENQTVCAREGRWKARLNGTASPSRRQASAWSEGVEIFCRGEPGEPAGRDDTDPGAPRHDRHPDPGGSGTPTSTEPPGPYPVAQLGFGMIRFDQLFTRLRTSVLSAECCPRRARMPRSFRW